MEWMNQWLARFMQLNDYYFAFQTRGVIQAKIHSTTHKTAHSTPHNTTQRIPHRTKQRIPHRTKQRIPHRTTRRIPQRTTQSIPHHTTQHSAFHTAQHSAFHNAQHSAFHNAQHSALNSPAFFFSSSLRSSYITLSSAVLWHCRHAKQRSFYMWIRCYVTNVVFYLFYPTMALKFIHNGITKWT